MRKIFLYAFVMFFSFQSYAQKEVERGLKAITESAARAHIEFLAHNELEGREAGFQGGRIAREYILSRLKELGIKPYLGTDFVQHFEALRVDHQRKGRFQVDPDSIAKLKEGTHQGLDMYNVLGYIPGERADEFVIVGAHYDHLGLDPYLRGDKIYNGADDNASGVSAVLQIAKAFVLAGVKPKRSVVFAFWDGEEKGLLGSKYFIQESTNLDQIKGYLNFDMIGRNNKPEKPNHVVYFYTEANKKFEEWLRRDIKKYKLNLEPDYRAWDKPIGGSDNGPFAKQNIPIIWYHTDGHRDYHKPTDHAEFLNWNKIVEITKASFLNMWHMANDCAF